MVEETKKPNKGKGRPKGSSKNNAVESKTVLKKVEEKPKVKTKAVIEPELKKEQSPYIELDPQFYTYRYFINTNKGGTIFITDIQRDSGHGLGKKIDFDEKGNTVYKIPADQANYSQALKHHLAIGNLREVTSQYLGYLELGLSVHFDFDPYKEYVSVDPQSRQAVELKDIPLELTPRQKELQREIREKTMKTAYVHLPEKVLNHVDPNTGQSTFDMNDYGRYLGMNQGNRIDVKNPDQEVISAQQKTILETKMADAEFFREMASKEGSTERGLPTLEKFSAVNGSSDEVFHKAASQNRTRPGYSNQADIMPLQVDSNDNGESGIIDPDTVSSARPQVDPRMYVQASDRRPQGPRNIKMRGPKDPFYNPGTEETLGGPKSEKFTEVAPPIKTNGPEISVLAKDLLDEE